MAKDLPPGYTALVKRLMVLIPQWCAAQKTLPDLKFYDHGRIMIAGNLEPRLFRILARSVDAEALLTWLDVQTNHEATIFQTQFALRQLGFLAGAELLTLDKLRELGGLEFAGVLSPGGAA